MHVVRETLLSDLVALANFAVPLVGLALAGSLLGMTLGALLKREVTLPSVRRSLLHGLCAGVILAMLIGMVLEFLLTWEGYAAGREALRERTTTALWLSAACVAFVAAIFSARRNSLPAESTPTVQRRFTLRQLFMMQLAVGLVLAWWGFTRRHEFNERHIDANWRARDIAAKSAFEPLGWTVMTFRDREDVGLHFPLFRRPLIGDEALHAVPHYRNVTGVVIISDKVTDEGLKSLALCPDLVYANIASNQVTDSGLATLAKSTSLRHLDVTCPQVTAGGLRSLAASKSLAFVQVFDAKANQDEAVELSESFLRIDWSIYRRRELLTPRADRQ